MQRVRPQKRKNINGGTLLLSKHGVRNSKIIKIY